MKLKFMLFTSLKLLLLLLPLSLSSAGAHFVPCDNDFSFVRAGMERNITHCKKLHTFGAEFGWNYFNSISPNTSIEIVFSAMTPKHGWLAWGLNPGKKPQMVGTRALIAFDNSVNGLAVNSYNITAQTKHGCKLEVSPIEVMIANVEANYIGRMGRTVIWANLSLPPEYNISRLHMVWQVGPEVVNLVPKRHARRLENFDSIETINLMTGHSFSYRQLRLRYAHGILSVLGWGFFLPIGVIVARYCRESPLPVKRWFRGHIVCQIIAFFLGTIAWSFGLTLMTSSPNFKTMFGHKIIGIFVFCLATVQMMALWLRPDRMDKYRAYWNIFHHGVGYTLIVLAVVNIFKGLSILEPKSKWKWAYIGILATLSSIALGFETTIWGKFGFQHFEKKDKPQQTMG